MEVNFTEIKKVSEVKKAGRPGSFSIASNPLSWIGCRDHFLKIFHNSQKIFFMTIVSGMYENVPSFILMTEEILKIQESGFEYSKFAKTNRSYVLGIEPSLFWRECEVKRSFFTALLRAGLEYNVKTNNYEEALYKRSYFRTTKMATMRFLFGHTKFVPDSSREFRGWVNAFSKDNENSIRRKLQLPKKEEKFLIGLGSLWR